MADLRDQIQISVYPSNERSETGGAIYLLRYQDFERDRAIKVVDILLNSFMKDTVTGKLANSAAAQQFLQSQIQETEQKLREAEQRLADFKKRNVGTMPGKEGDYFTRLQNEMDAAKAARTALSVAISRRDELSKQLRDGALLAASSGAAPPATTTGDRNSARDTLTQLAEAQAKLDALLRQYTERHPDVGALRETIAQLKIQHERELEALRRGDSDTALPAGVTSSPVYQSVRLQLNEANVEVAALNRQLAAHEGKVAELRRLVNSMPEVEAEFARLNRDYDVHKSQYVALVDRLEKANLGQDAEATGSGLRLEVLDPPTAPFGPVAPNRPRLMVFVFMLGTALGVVLAYVLSKLNPVFNHSRELQDATGLPVLGEVSLTWLHKYQRATRRGFLAYSAATAGLFLVCAVLVIWEIKAA
jgi:polysaccharide chain length determinant protein (PEP-CTERM system associated)